MPSRLKASDFVHAVRRRGRNREKEGPQIVDRVAGRLIELGRSDVAYDVMRDHRDRRPFVLTVRDERVFAWCRGFDDPRIGVPESAYDISDAIVLRAGIDEIRWHSGNLVIGGFAHLSRLDADRDERVSIALDDARGGVLSATTERVRRPDRVPDSGAGLTRLAWTGFRAVIDGESLLATRGTFTITATIARGALQRTARPGPTRVAGLRAALPYDLSTETQHVVRLCGNSAVTVTPMLPRPAPWRPLGGRRRVSTG